ncbi:MAG: tetratricopeptide repeat protein [Planctomycetota bacterium]
MSLRKEQVLLALVALLAVWVGMGYLDTPTYQGRVKPGEKEFVAQPVGTVVLAGDAAAEPVRRDFCTEPSETRPLPPRELDFPQHPPLSLAGLPLDPGPDYHNSWLLRRDGAQVSGAAVTLGVGDSGAGDSGANETAGTGEEGADVLEPVAGGAGGTQDVEPGPMTDAQIEKLYDRLWVVGQANPYYGRLEQPDGVDLFALEDGGQFANVKLRLRIFSRKDKKLGNVQPFGAGASQQVARIRLAETMRNEVQRRVRKVPSDQPAVGQRRELIEWLLEQGQVEAWVYEEALKQAEVYAQVSGGVIEAKRLLQRVYRAMGDLDGEFALLQGLSGQGAEGPFQALGLGQLQARLGLWADAEANLRRAVELSPNDASTHGGLAEFLRMRGRSREAIASARRARQTLGAVQDKELRASIVRTIFACQLAVGDVDGARETASSMTGDGSAPYLRGCLAYAAGDAGSALGNFRSVTAGPDLDAALLAQAACLEALGTWQEAFDLFARVADQAPLLRHRACTGQALVLMRVGQFDAALAFVDRALEAAPRDAYALYLRGRTLRLMGQAQASIEALIQALAERDDFVHAIAEMSAAQAELATVAAGTEQVEALFAARRYAERAVELSPTEVIALYEIAGLRAFAAGDPRAAKSHFEKARSLGDDDPTRAFARGAICVVDYSRARVDDAVVGLTKLARDQGRDDPMGQWAEATIDLIEKHALKEQLGDSFDREELGSNWERSGDGAIKVVPLRGRLGFSGTFNPRGDGEVSVARVAAVKHAKNFLAASVSIEAGPTNHRDESFFGLGVDVPKGSNEIGLRARIGVKSGAPYLYILDGKEQGRDNEKLVKLAPELLRDGKPQRVELRVVPRGDEQGRQLSLQVWFNGSLVHVHELKQINGSTTTELRTVLFGSGDKGTKLDVAFDDYVLERNTEVQPR